MIFLYYIVKDIKANFLNIYFLSESKCSEYTVYIIIKYFSRQSFKDLVLLSNKETRYLPYNNSFRSKILKVYFSCQIK